MRSTCIITLLIPTLCNTVENKIISMLIYHNIRKEVMSPLDKACDLEIRSSPEGKTSKKPDLTRCAFCVNESQEINTSKYHGNNLAPLIPLPPF